MKNDIQIKDVQNRIFIIRDVQVMIDSDLAELYAVNTKVLNQAVKRNIERFPETFRFQLIQEEWKSLQLQINDKSLRSQFVTGLNLKSQSVTSRGHGGRRTLPYAFTEQGVAMLSAVLRSETAIKVSIQIMQAFVEIKKFITNNAAIFQRLDKIEQRQFISETKLDKVFKALESGKLPPNQGIFFNGQVFDAYTFVSGLIRSAKKAIILIDNYIDDTIRVLLRRSKTFVITKKYKNISSVGAIFNN